MIYLVQLQLSLYKAFYNVGTNCWNFEQLFFPFHFSSLINKLSSYDTYDYNKKRVFFLVLRECLGLRCWHAPRCASATADVRGLGCSVSGLTRWPYFNEGRPRLSSGWGAVTFHTNCQDTHFDMHILLAWKFTTPTQSQAEHRVNAARHLCWSRTFTLNLNLYQVAPRRMWWQSNAPATYW